MTPSACFRRRSGRAALLAAVSLLAIGSLCGSALAAPALPTGGRVQAGVALIGAPAGGSLTVNQSSARAIIDWASFSIGSAGTVRFDNGSGATLNRVTGALGSQIDGALFATGSVYLLNPNGVIVGQGGAISVGGTFVASTLGLSNSAFMNGGNLTFSGASSAPIVNAGDITAGGDVALIGATVENDGQISAPNGTAALAAGRSVAMDAAAGDDGKLQVLIGGAQTSATNTGLIEAANAELRANGGNVYALAVGTGSKIVANGVSATDGKVFLVAGAGGSVTARGEIDATRADGSGGSVETSGATVDFTGVTVKAANWLIDPTDLTVDSAAASTISGNLATTSVTLQTTASGASGPGVQSPGAGDIVVDAPISWSSANGLTLDAYHSIGINAAITASGAGALALKTNDGGSGGSYGFAPGASIMFTGTPGGGQGLTINGQAYGLVYSKTDLTNINSNLAGFYALAAPLDLSGTTFAAAPIANSSGPAAGFTGVFTGLGNTIYNLTVVDTTPVLETLPAGYAINGAVGLFGTVGSGGVVSNIDLANAQVTGGDGMRVGALVGADFGTVINATSSGAVTTGNSIATAAGTAFAFAGGLVGTSGAVVNSHSSATVNGGDAFAGGLVGAAGPGASINDSYAAGDVTVGADIGVGAAEAGGLVGLVYGYQFGGVNPVLATVAGSYATGNVSGGGGSILGGFVGDVTEGQITTSYATGSVTQTAGDQNGQADAAGGFAGVTFTGGAISQSWSSGAVNVVGSSGLPIPGQPAGNNFVTPAGGFVGDMDQASTVSESYALGPVTSTGSSSSILGGFAGVIVSGAAADHVYATGLVSGPGLLGGLVGLLGCSCATVSSGSLTDSYWDEGTTGQTNGYNISGTGSATNVTGIGGSTGISPYAAATYGNFDLTNTWYLIEGSTRPILRSEYSTTIVNAHQLQLMSLNLSANYTLAADIDASETTNPSGVWNPANGFVPVGATVAAPFTGVLDGQGHAVFNLTITDTTAVPQTIDGAASNGVVGLFGVVGAGGLIQNISLSNAQVTGGDGMFVGAVAGVLGGSVINASSSGAVATGAGDTDPSSATAIAGGLVGAVLGSIAGSNSSATVNAGDDAFAGGLAGVAVSGASIAGSYATGAVSTGGYSGGQQVPDAGGLVGGLSGNPTGGASIPVTVATSYATGAVSGGGGSNVGGFAGELDAGQISTSWASGGVTQTAGGQNGQADAAGGFIGRIGVGGVVTQSWSGGAVNTFGGPDSGDATYAGGFVGVAEDGGAVSNSYALDPITSTGSSFSVVGGFAGAIQSSASASEVYATGLVTGAGAVAGLVGQVGNSVLSDTSGSLSNSYWDEGTTGQTTGYYLNGTGAATNVTGIGGSTGVSPYAAATYGAFDLINTWLVIDGSTRPILRSEYATTIVNSHQLQLMYLGLGASYTLANDIDLSETTQAWSLWNPATGFVPVGGNANPGGAFAGGFDGQGHTLSNLTITDTTASLQTLSTGVPTNGFVGLFGVVSGGGADIQNINLANAHVTGGDGMVVGALVGAQLDGAIFGASSSGVVTTGSGVSTVSGFANSSAGGLVGALGAPIYYSNSSATVTGGGAYVGGLAGWTAAGAAIIGSFATGAVTTGGYLGGQQGPDAGGLVGYLSGYQFDGTNPSPIGVTGSYATGAVTAGGGADVGGFAGDVFQAQVSTSFATGSVTQTAGGQNMSDSIAGGFAGYMGAGASITQSYAGGAVNTVGGPNSIPHTEAGGFVGLMQFGAAVSEAYAIGPVTAKGGSFSNLGGFAGVVQLSASIDHVYASGLVTGVGDVAGLVGYVGSVGAADHTGYVLDSYWDEGTTGQTKGYNLFGAGTATNVVGIGGPTGINPYLAATYGAFDLTNTWYLIEGSTRPILRSEYSTTIVTAHQLQLMDLNLGAYYTLAGDIDASETSQASGVWNPATGFAPVGGNGNSAGYFTGVLDGAGHTISDLTVIGTTPAVVTTPLGYSTDREVGLFGVIGAGGLVQNVNLANVNATGGDGTQVGALAGISVGAIVNASSSGAVTTGNGDDPNSAPAAAGGLVGGLGGSIAGSHSSATVTGAVARVGGLVGETVSGSIANSFATGAVNVGSQPATFGEGVSGGGLAGYLIGASFTSPTTVTGSYATGAVSGGGGSHIGGFAGLVQSTQITTSWATGSVTQTAPPVHGQNWAGGFAGLIGVGGVVTQSWSSGAVNTVSGSSGHLTLAGGFVGDLNGGSVSQSYALGAVTSTGSPNAYLGGFAGIIESGASADQVYATGLIAGLGNVGGLSGLVGVSSDADTSGSLSDSYWDEGTTGQTVGYNLSGTGTATNVTGIGGSTGISPYAAATYANFDLTNIWYLIEGSTRPILRSEYSTTIVNAHQLQLMGLNLAASYTLAADIDASETSQAAGVWNVANGFVPVGGAVGAPFTGALDGQGHTIFSLTITDTTPVAQTFDGIPINGAVGLFGVVGAGGVLKNLSVEASVTGGDGMLVGALAGAVAGSVTNAASSGLVITGAADIGAASPAATVGGLIGASTGSIVDSSSSASVAGGFDSYAGGLVGLAVSGATITGSHATGDVSTGGFSGGPHGSYAGGLVGVLDSSLFDGGVDIPVSATGSYATGPVTGGGGSDIGGFVGQLDGGQATGSYATGSVTQTAGDQGVQASVAGGFAGQVFNATVAQSWSSGAVNTVGGSNLPTLAGGFVGELGSGSTLSYAYSLGPVASTGSALADLGGFAGAIDAGGSGDNVYATGLVSGSGTVGGLVGALNGGLSNGYWDEGTTGQIVAYGASSGTATNLVGVGGSTGLSPYAAATYANFDLAGEWYLIEGETRPILRSEYSTTITNDHQLELMNLNLSADYTLAGDIDARFTVSASGVWNEANGFVPVGGFQTSGPFTGVLDGQGHSIFGLAIFDSTQPSQTIAGFGSNGAVGLIGVLGAGGVVQNLDLGYAFVSGGDGEWVGALVGANLGSVLNDASTAGFVSAGNSINNSNTNGGSAIAGGLVGASVGTIVGSHSSATVVAGNDAFAGGLVGAVAAGGSVANSYATGNVSVGGQTASNQGNNQGTLAGGLVGLLYGYHNGDVNPVPTTITDSYATGNVTGGAGSFIGGFVGKVIEGQIGTSYATGTVTQTAGGESGINDDIAGGFAGVIDVGGSVSQSFARGAVIVVGGPDAADPTFAGGFVGGMRLGASVSNAYATGPVTSSGSAFADLGGFAGLVQQSASVDHVYAIGLVSGPGMLGGLVGQLGDTDQTDTSGFLSDSYWDEGTTGQTVGYNLAGTGAATRVAGMGGATGVSPFLAATYAGWDFTNIWSPPSTRFYPELYGVSHVLRITVGDSYFVYGGVPAFAASYYGLQNGDGAQIVSGLSLAALATTTSSSGFTNVGVYALAGSGAFADGASSTEGGGIYRVIYVNGALTVTPRSASASLTGTVEKTYDGTTAATLAPGNYQLAGTVFGDNVALNDPSSGTYDTRNAGTGKTVSVAGLALNGSDAQDYTVNGAAAAPIGIIDPAALILSAVSDTKTYDGTTSSAQTPTESGLVEGDSLSFLSQSFASRNAGTQSLNVDNGYVVNDANGGNNYVVTLQSAQGTIDPAALILSAVSDTKTYDGTTSSAQTPSESGLVEGDSLSFLSQSFASRNAGTQTLNVDNGYVVNDGNGGNNYVVTLQSAQGTIDPAALLLSAVSDTKTYDGTTSSAQTPTESGLVEGDSLSFLSQSFASRNAGTQTLNVDNGYVVNDGNGGNNYVVTLQSAQGTIDPAALIAALTGTVEKTYDGTTAATLAPANYQLSGAVSGDNVALNDPASGTYDSKNVGSEKTVSVGGLVLTGSDAGNYTVNGSASAAIGVVDAKALVASLAGTVERQYDGTTVATLAGANYQLAGAIAGDNVALNDPASGAYDSKTVGTGKTVSVMGLALTGSDAGNYTVNGSASAPDGVIDPRVLTASLTGTVQKPYDGTTTATLTPANYQLSGGVVSGDTVDLNDPASGTYDTAAPGTGKTVDVTGLALTGSDASDYTVSPDASGPVGVIVGNPAPPIQTTVVTVSPAADLVADTTVVDNSSAAGPAAGPAGGGTSPTSPTSRVGIFPVIGAPPSDFISGDNSPVTGAGNGDLWAGSGLDEPCDLDKECKR
jgi:filamentous hemagglutinin family protein